jgi:hypothetical protein
LPAASQAVSLLQGVQTATLSLPDALWTSLLTLGFLSLTAGFTATAMGCGGFAAFSVGIDWLMMDNH